MIQIEKLFLRLGLSGGAEHVVPPSGHTAWLTTLTSGAMAFLAVFALALSLATDRLANRWSAELARTATVRISAPVGQVSAQVAAVLNILETTPGIENARALSDDETKNLLEPWFGPDLPVESLPIPALIEIIETQDGFDPANLRLRLSAEAPGAVLDDHSRWRAPLIRAADMLRMLGLISIILITGTLGAMVTLAANASLAANGQIIRVLRLIGANDSYIARAFVRRFTLRSTLGAFVGVVCGSVAIFALPEASFEGGFLTGLGFQGLEWLLPFGTIPIATLTGFVATRMAAFRTLRGMT
jgi:cell division transport system permease protein